MERIYIKECAIDAFHTAIKWMGDSISLPDKNDFLYLSYCSNSGLSSVQVFSDRNIEEIKRIDIFQSWGEMVSPWDCSPNIVVYTFTGHGTAPQRLFEIGIDLSQTMSPLYWWLLPSKKITYVKEFLPTGELVKHLQEENEILQYKKIRAFIYALIRERENSLIYDVDKIKEKIREKHGSTGRWRGYLFFALDPQDQLWIKKPGELVKLAD